MNVLKKFLDVKVQGFLFAVIGVLIVFLALPFMNKTVDVVGFDLAFMTAICGFGFTMFVVSILDILSSVFVKK